MVCVRTAARRARGQAAAGLGAGAPRPVATPEPERRAGRRCPRSRSTRQIAAYILNAALRSQSLADISAERLDVELPPAGALRGPEHAAVQAAGRRGRPRRRSSRRSTASTASSGILDELELPLIPVLATMEATASPSTTPPSPSCARPSATEIARLRGGHLRGRRPRVHARLSPSSSSRSCSTS